MTLNKIDLALVSNTVKAYLDRAADVFVFTLTFSTQKDEYNTVEERKRFVDDDNDDEDEENMDEDGSAKFSVCNVVGVIFYYPFDREETKPKSNNEFETSE